MRPQRHARRQQDQPERPRAATASRARARELPPRGRRALRGRGGRRSGRRRCAGGRAPAPAPEPAWASGTLGLLLPSSPNGSSYCSSPALCAARARAAGRGASAATGEFDANWHAPRVEHDCGPSASVPPDEHARHSTRPAPKQPSPARPAGGPRSDPETGKAIGLAAATMAANLVAVVFTVIFTRLLGADDYGSLAALLNLSVILFVPGSALQVAAAREGTLGRLGRGGELAGTLARWSRHILDRAGGRRRRVRAWRASRWRR